MDAMIGRRGFAILSLAEGGRAFAVPLFYGVHEGAYYFQTRPGDKTHYLYATMEACLSVNQPLQDGQWCSVQVFGRLERVDAGGDDRDAHAALRGVSPPLEWAHDDRGLEARSHERPTTFRIQPTRRTGLFTQAAAHAPGEDYAGY